MVKAEALATTFSPPETLSTLPKVLTAWQACLRKNGQNCDIYCETKSACDGLIVNCENGATCAVHDNNISVSAELETFFDLNVLSLKEEQCIDPGSS